MTQLTCEIEILPGRVVAHRMRLVRIWGDTMAIVEARERNGLMDIQIEPVEPRVGAALGLLRGNNERVSRARQAVLEVLDATSEHLNADEIALRVAAKAPGVHRATVYRTLLTLAELKLVRHTHVPGGAAVYHFSVDETTAVESVSDVRAHAHVRCTTCGTVIDIPLDTMQLLADRIENEFDFLLEPQHAALLGTCASCRKLGSCEEGQPTNSGAFSK
jgi:Fur family ferric uptake transcriptional regulator